MSNTARPTSPQVLLTEIDHALANLVGQRETALDQIIALDTELAALGYHPNYPAYVHGGILADKGFGSAHILPVAGFYDLEWREALDRFDKAPTDPGDDAACLLVRLRHACEADAMLEVAGLAWCEQSHLLKRGAVDGYWLKRPKLGLGQPAKAFGLRPEHAAAHRGLFALSTATLKRGFENVSVNQVNQRFGAMLPAVISAGGQRLVRIGAKALHDDAETRYRDDCRRFAAHQAATPDRRWRWKPPLSAQGHLAVTTARAKGIAMPAERTRGHAAGWLDDHDANIRFAREDGE